MIEGAIFDADGTLLDSMSIWDKAGEIYLGSTGIEAEPGLGRIMFSMTMQEGAAYLKNNYNLMENTDEIQDGINRTVRNFYLNDVQLKPGVKDFLKELHAAGIPMTVATSSDIEQIEAAFERLQILKYFRNIFTCTLVGRGKEFPDIYYEAAKVMSSSPAKTIVFEDALHAAKTALTAGFVVAGVYDCVSSEKQEELKNISDYYIKDFNDTEDILKELV